MPFGQQQRPSPPAERDRPMRLRWDGTAERAHEFQDWGRDEALIPIAAVTPPSRDAAAGTPAAAWRLRAKIQVAPELGGGEQWVDVPEGATVRNTGTWAEPVLEIITSAASAAVLSEE